MSKKTKLKTDNVLVENEINSPEKILENKEKNIILSEELGSEKNIFNPEVENIFNPEGELVIDVFETNSDFVVLTAIAGVEIKNLDISVEEDMMVIKGQRVNPHDNSEKKYFYQECYWGPFSRKIVLPENIKTKAAQAQMDKGVLTIKIPKITEVNKKEPVKLA